MLTKLFQLLCLPAVVRDWLHAKTWTPREKLRELPAQWKASGGNFKRYWTGNFKGSVRGDNAAKQPKGEDE